MGHTGTFSLNNYKNLCGGEGGLFTTDDEGLLNKGVLIRCFGDEVDEVSQRRVYNASILGYMYRNQELPAALARGQLRHLDENNAAAHRQRQLSDRAAEQDSRRHPALLSAGLQARLLHVQCALRSQGCRRRLRAAPLPHRRREGAVQGRRAGGPVADDAGAGAGPVPEHARLRRLTLSLGDQRSQRHHIQLRLNQFPVAKNLCDTYTIVHGVHAPNDAS